MSNLQPLNAVNRREADRRCALDDYLCLVDLGDSRSAMLLDVSETGIGVQSVEGVGEGFTTRFRFQLPDTAVLIEGEGEIAWVDRAGRMGVRFTRIADDLKPELRKWVASEANPLFAHQPESEETADLDARDRVAQLEARIIVSGWAQLQALNFLVDQIAAMTQASGVAIAVEDGSGIVCKASSGIAPQAGVRVNPRSGLSWECVRTKEVVTCVDTENDPRVDRLVCRELNMRSAMLVPVKKDDRVAGLVEVFSSRPHAFTNQTVILLRRVAEAVASLDETAPDVSDNSILRMPPQKPKAQPVATAPAPPTPVVARSAPQAVPPPAPAPKAAAPVTVTQRPSIPTGSVPAAAAAPAPVRPTPAPAPAPAATKIGVPFAQEVAAATAKPAPAPAKSAEKPPVIAAPAASASHPAVKPAEVKPVEKLAPEPVIATAKAQPASVPPVEVKQAQPPQPKPVAATTEVPLPAKPPIPQPAPQKIAAAPAVERTAAVPNPVPSPAPIKPPSQAAPRPVGSSGVSASPATGMFEAPAAPAAKITAPVAPQKEERRPIPDDMPDILLLPHPDDAPNRRRMYVTAAVVGMIGISTVGGWYVAKQGSATTPQSAASATAATAQPPATQPAAASTANLSLPLTSETASPVPTSTQPSSKQPVTTSSPASRSEYASRASGTAQPSTPEPMPVATRSSVPPPVESSPPPPPALAIAPPNTVGMASLLSGPVAAPTLGRANISRGVSGGRQIVKTQPVYPATARALHLSGVVVMTAHVSTNGTVSDVKVLRGHPLLNGAAIEAVKRWKYEPFMLNGEAIENDVNVQVKFDMPR